MREYDRYVAHLGRASTKLVKRKLWTYGYAVKDVSKIFPFALLVNDKYKTEVKYSKFYAKAGKVFWVLKDVSPHCFDVLTAVLQMPTGGSKSFFMKNSFIGKAGDLRIDENNLKAFSSSPLKIFVGSVANLDIKPRKIVLREDDWYSLTEVAFNFLKTTKYKVRKIIEQKKLKAVPLNEGKSRRYSLKGAWVIKYLLEQNL